MDGGGGADTGDVEKTTEKNIAFQKDIANQVLGLSAPYNQVGFDALSNLAVLSGVDAPTLKPNYAGVIGDPRFVQTGGTVDERIAALGSVPDQFITSTTPSINRQLDPSMFAAGDDGAGRAYNRWLRSQQGASGGATTQTANPAYQAYLDSVNAIRAQGDQPGPMSTADRRDKVVSDFYASPEYNITFQDALKASTKQIGQAAAARGQLNSAPTFNAVGENAGTLANSTFGQFRNNLSQLAGFGTTGLATSTNALGNAGSQVGAAFNNLANVQGNAAIQQANQRSSGFGSLLGGLGSLAGMF